MKFLAKRRFNYIDVVSACIVVQLVVSDDYLAALVVWLLSTFISVFVEMKFGEQQ